MARDTAEETVSRSAIGEPPQFTLAAQRSTASSSSPMVRDMARDTEEMTTSGSDTIRSSAASSSKIIPPRVRALVLSSLPVAAVRGLRENREPRERRRGAPLCQKLARLPGGGKLKPIPDLVGSPSPDVDDASDCTGLFRPRDSTSPHHKQRHTVDPPAGATVLDLSLTPGFSRKKNRGPDSDDDARRLLSPSMNFEESLTTTCGDLPAGEINPSPDVDDASDCTGLFRPRDSTSPHHKQRRTADPPAGATVLDLSLTPGFSRNKNKGPDSDDDARRLLSPSMNSEESLTTTCGDLPAGEIKLLNLFG
ncbi:Unknown protein [Striga hermonthica]|uniref:Uncharacterized protein n=1 Tax=Striga hermonthica TaxID=68872 RepID=A0A9N7RK02_STRHE|nr:Unknown protein [Striga hermonthica]